MDRQTESAAPGTRRPGGRWKIPAAAGVLSAATLAAYHATFSAPLLFDDTASIENNPSLRNWLTALWPPAGRTVSGRPVLNFSLAINHAVGGTAVGSYHAFNLAIHVLAGLVLFGIVRRTLAPRVGAAAAAIAFSTALFWTLHPLQTGAVTYIVQRAESLMGLFYLLTLYCFIRGAETDGPAQPGPAARGGRRTLWFALAFASCLLGMGTKEVMASAPLIVLLYDRTFIAGSFREAWRRRWKVFAALASTWLLLAFLVASTYGRRGAAGSEIEIVWWRYALAQLPAIAHYLRLCLWPSPLIFDYGTALAPPSWRLLPDALVVLGLAAATGWALARRPALGFLGAAFFAILAPSSSIVPVAGETMADYRMYLPSIPVAALAALGIHRWLGRAALPVCAILAAGLALATAQRNRDYSSERAIWSDTVAQLPENYRARNNLGNALVRIPGRLPEAADQYEAALRIRPDDAEIHYNLGEALARIPGRLADAIAQYETALKLKPAYSEAHNNLGEALAQVPGRLTDAIEHYEAALRLKPDNAEAHNNLGAALAQVPGRLPEAIAQYEAALQLRPGNAEAQNNLGAALAQVPGRRPEAIGHYEAALELRPNYAEAHYNLAVACAETPGRLADAIEHYEAALKIAPDFAEAHFNLGNALLEAGGREPEARAQFEAAVRLRPDWEALVPRARLTPP